MKLSKRIPARTKTLTANWCRKDYLAMSEQYRRIRSKSRKPMDKCYWCKHAFENGEMMALAQFKQNGNQVLCGDCADELLASKTNI